MATQITLPHMGEGIESGDILAILVSAGDTISVDQDLVEIETDKATMPVPSPQAGKVVKILVAEGDTVTVGTAILELEPAETASAALKPTVQPPEPAPTPTPKRDKPKPAEVQPEPTPEPVEQVQEVAPLPVAAEAAPPRVVVSTDEPGDGYSSAAAGPAARRLARELGVDLRRVRPSGDGNRVTEDDLRQHASRHHPARPARYRRPWRNPTRKNVAHAANHRSQYARLLYDDSAVDQLR